MIQCQCISLLSVYTKHSYMHIRQINIKGLKERKVQCFERWRNPPGVQQQDDMSNKEFLQKTR